MEYPSRDGRNFLYRNRPKNRLKLYSLLTLNQDVKLLLIADLSFMGFELITCSRLG